MTQDTEARDKGESDVSPEAGDDWGGRERPYGHA